jgi:catechol 2,3-dioxygenase-like lactoylglutathione lyase family enzyme
MTAGGCGCPPTAIGSGGVHHVFVNVTDVGRAREFYGWLMPLLGYPGVSDYGGIIGWYGDGGSFWLKQAAAVEPFSKDRVGLAEIAFRAERREQVDALARELTARGARILDPPREYDYTPGYYAVFFTDPDGIKLELVHIPATSR